MPPSDGIPLTQELYTAGARLEIAAATCVPPAEFLDYPDDVELRGEFPALTSIGAWAFHYADPDPRIPITTIAIAAPRLRFIGTRAFGHHETGTTEQHLSGSSFRSPCHCMAHM